MRKIRDDKDKRLKAKDRQDKKDAKDTARVLDKFGYKDGDVEVFHAPTTNERIYEYWEVMA